MRLRMLPIVLVLTSISLNPSHAADATQHLMPAATPVETSSIDKSTPPDADIGAAARALIPTPKAATETAPPPQAIEADTKPDIGPTATATPPATPPELTLDEKDQLALAELYVQRNDAPLWVSKIGYSPNALALISELGKADTWGLSAADYEVPKLEDNATRDDLAKADYAVSLALLKYARDARGGRIADPAKTLSSYLDRKPQVRDRKLVLETLSKSSEPVAYLLGLHPQQPEFNRLRQAWLETKRQRANRGVTIGTSDLKPGDRGADVAVLRKRMMVPANTAADEDLYDGDLIEAVKGFQSLKGLEANGVLVAETRQALNKPAKGDDKQLLANMQMWRWLPEDLGSLYVTVNVPEFMIRLVKNDQPIFTERVTVGLVDKQTPIFSDQMERVTFKSLWNVPDSIKVKEIWPSLMRGGGLMREHNLRIRRDDNGQDVDWRKINWSKADMREYDVYRPPGPTNQLGVVKFSFPSKHYVFMHDTNEKFMFNYSRRANSHGCMRVRNPLTMASLILTEDKGPGWGREKMDDLVKNGPDHNIVELGRKVPVHITYLTVRIDEKGTIKAFPDVYGHQKRITQALIGQWTKIAKGRDHLAPLDQSTPPRVVVASKRTKFKKDDSVLGLLSAALGGL
jgi:L,D-transpeptidase YcbB